MSTQYNQNPVLNQQIATLASQPYNPAYDEFYKRYNITPASPVPVEPTTFSPNLKEQFGKTERMLGQYSGDLGKWKDPLTQGPQMTYNTYDPVTGKLTGTSKPTSDLSAGLRDVGAYQQQDYLYDPSLYEYKAPEYAQTDYQGYETFKAAAPGEYQGTQYDFAQQYKAPDAYQAFQYETPEIADLERVNPVADEIWAGRQAAEMEGIGQQYADTRERMKQAAIQTAARPEQMAALEANLGIEEGKARTAAQRELDFQRAQQGVGIAQTEQALQAQKATTAAQMQAATQEQQAQEMANKYGLDVDAARYIVQQQASQQQAQAAENQAAFGANLGRAKELAGQQMTQQQAQAAENQYRTQKAADDAKFQLGLKQAQAEAQAGEYEKAYQSRYGLAQDTAQTAMAQSEAQKAAYYDYLNAQLQGQQAQSQNAAQQATYQTNLSQEERGAQKGEQEKYATQLEAKKRYDQGTWKQPTNVGATTTKTTTQTKGYA